MVPLVLAFSFLTRYPVPRLRGELSPEQFGRSTGYFPLAGLVLGLDLLLLRWVLGWAGILQHWPLAAAAVILVYGLWAGDSLHLDGLADTVDGLASGRQGEELLEVMHDSRSGAFGVQAIGAVLLLKFAYLASLPPKLWWALPLPLLFSRLWAALLCQSRPYAGRAGSLSGWFIEANRSADASVALAWTFLAFGGLCTLAVLTGLAEARACALALGACVTGMLVATLLVQIPRRRLGGISGDLIGYGLVLCELVSAYLLLFVLGA